MSKDRGATVGGWELRAPQDPVSQEETGWGQESTSTEEGSLWEKRRPPMKKGGLEGEGAGVWNL